jgi:tetratricopeptide (TPR) repeat protein
MSSILDSQPSSQLTNADLARKNFEFAKRLIESGETRRAIRLLETSVEQAPEVETLYLLAQLELERVDQQHRALEHLKQAVALAPNHIASWMLLANYWSVRGKPEKQRRCLEKILALDPGNRDVRTTLGLLDTPK